MESKNETSAPSSSIKRTRMPGIIKREVKEVVYKVYKFLTLHNLAEYTTLATGISTRNVKRIIREGDESITPNSPNPKFPTPKLRVKFKNEFDEGELRRCIQEFYLKKKDNPTLDKVYDILKEHETLNFGKENLRQLILEIGFMFKKTDTKRRLLIEKPEITILRERYLQAIKRYRDDQRPIIFLDEFSVYVAKETMKSPKPPQGYIKPVHWIVVHAGGDMGFIPNALLIYKSHTTCGEFHGEMNADNFIKWLLNYLVPNLPPQSVVIMDDEAYHRIERSQKPNILSPKAKLQEWLHEKGISFSPEITKAGLLEIIKSLPWEKNYVVDELLQEHGHSVLRLPPYHRDLNPIVLISGFIKNKIDKECEAMNLGQKRTYLEMCCENFSVDMWQKCCAHVIKLEDEYRENDRLMDKGVDNIIKNLQIQMSPYSESDEDSDY